jgi:hypothetical protein
MSHETTGAATKRVEVLLCVQIKLTVYSFALPIVKKNGEKGEVIMAKQAGCIGTEVGLPTGSDHYSTGERLNLTNENLSGCDGF